MKKIQVLMSTYNGEKFVRQQIESIINQKNVEVHILVRDDGSKDKTVKILKEYNCIDIIEASNVGATRSFFELIDMAGDFDFYAFADQDDVWDNDKLSKAIDMIRDYECPVVYSSNTRLVDAELKFIKNEESNPNTNLGSAIVKNYVTGCTEVFNKQLINYLRAYHPVNVPFHDWWTNLVCLSVGGVSLYDFEPHINYRQHGNNVVGGNNSFFKKWKSRFNKFLKTQYHRDLMAKDIRDNYKKYISSDNLRILNSIIEKKYIKEMSSGNKIDDLLFRICILFGKV